MIADRNEVDVFTQRLCELTKFSLLETVRQQANSLVREGNPYFAALLRELANRYEVSK